MTTNKIASLYINFNLFITLKNKALLQKRLFSNIYLHLFILYFFISYSIQCNTGF